jgi:type IX secretion system PorP/SprF family membrane protein
MKKLILCFLVFVLADMAVAQSYHFSQFFSTPLLTNPANTGFTNGPFRVSSNFRSQGMPGGNNQFTGYVSADASPFRDYITEGHKAGVGIYVMNDHSLTSAVQTNSVGLSAAYHVGLDIYSEQSFGLGIQGTYNQRRLNYNKLTFENQYTPVGYDPSLPIGESLNFDSKSFFDLNAGVVYNYNVANRAFFAGLSVYNILRHKDNVLEDDYKMPMRFSFQAGSQVPVSTSENVYVSLTAMHQAGTTEATLGGAYGFNLSETEEDRSEIIGGLWYRFKDALIPYIGYQHNSFQVGFSYDYTASGMKTGAQVRNGMELTLQFRAPDRRDLKMNIPWY